MKHKQTLIKMDEIKKQIDIKLSHGYKLVNDIYLISKNNEVPYKLFKAGKPYLSEMRPMPINFAGISSKGIDYFYKTISINGKSRNYLHRVVWETYNGEIPKGLTLDHIDGDRWNNNLSNLQLLTRAENSRKTIKQTHKNNGFDNHMKSLYNIIRKKVICNETQKVYDSIRDAAKDIKGDESLISLHLNGKLRDGYPVKTIKGKTFKFYNKDMMI